MDKFDKDLDDILDLTDSDESSSSSNPGIFESNQPFILELHELKKDDPATDKVTPEAKIKKKKKRSHPTAENKNGSVSSSADSIPRVTDAAGKEEFYDADGSFHELEAQDSRAKPAATVALAQAHSEHSQDPKVVPEPTVRSQHTSATPREPSHIITKPAVPPE